MVVLQNQMAMLVKSLISMKTFHRVGDTCRVIQVTFDEEEEEGGEEREEVGEGEEAEDMNEKFLLSNSRNKDVILQ